MKSLKYLTEKSSNPVRADVLINFSDGMKQALQVDGSLDNRRVTAAYAIGIFTIAAIITTISGF